MRPHRQRVILRQAGKDEAGRVSTEARYIPRKLTESLEGGQGGWGETSTPGASLSHPVFQDVDGTYISIGSGLGLYEDRPPSARWISECPSLVMLFKKRSMDALG